LIEVLISIFLCLNAYNTDINEESKVLACERSQRMVSKSSEMNLDPFIFYAVIHHESRWRSDAVSAAGACGLTQVIPKWTGDMTGGVVYSCEELKDPRTSIRAGMHALNYWLTRANGNVVKGLCAYNAGNRCLSKDHDGRSRYVQAVMATANSLRRDWSAIMNRLRIFFTKYETIGRLIVRGVSHER